MNERHTVRSTYKNRPASVPLMGAGIGGGIAAILALTLVFGGIGLWWFYVRVNVTAEIQRDSFEFQQTARDQLVDFDADLARVDAQIAGDITDNQRTALIAQRAAMAEQLCSTAAGLSGDLSPIHINIINKECS